MNWWPADCGKPGILFEDVISFIFNQQRSTAMSQDVAAPIIRILKTATCSNLTNKSTLGYHIGCNDQSEICFRISSNSGGGYFSTNWIPLKAILSAMEQAPKPLTSFALMPLFAGKSINTQSFLWATLLAEGLVQRDAENPRVYVACPLDAFQAEMDLLIASDTNLPVPAQITGKGVIKNKRLVVDPATLIKPRSRGRPKKSKSAATKP